MPWKCECGKRCTYGLPGGKAQWCVKHKPDGAVNVNSRKCEHFGCEKQPTYGNDAQKARWCVSHAPDGAVDVSPRERCERPGCIKRPTYGNNGKRARWCVSHAPDGAVDVKHIRCEHSGCRTRPNYGNCGEKARWCVVHKSDDAANVNDKRCEYSGCGKQPTYGNMGKKARWCVKHAPLGAMNVKNKKCERTGCGKIPTYGYAGGKSRWCVVHKLDGAVDVVNKRCIHPGCSKQPSRGIGGERPQWCSTHAPDEAVDVGSKRCEHSECDTIISGKFAFGFPGNIPTRCIKHRMPGMIRRPRGRCVVCKIARALYSPVNFDYPLRCEDCKDDGDICVVYRECTKCGSLDICDPEGLCVSVCAEFYRRKIHLYKQHEVEVALRVADIPLSTVDSVVEATCGKERPDFVIDLGTLVVIIECDENQHASYPHKCENTRMFNIGQMFGGTPVVFIRYNPDKYVDSNGVDHYPDQKDGRARRTRLVKVVQEIQTHLDEFVPTSPSKLALVRVCRLYYDGFNSRVSFRKGIHRLFIRRTKRHITS